jgi:hypothetical protein
MRVCLFFNSATAFLGNFQQAPVGFCGKWRLQGVENGWHGGCFITGKISPVAGTPTNLGEGVGRGSNRAASFSTAGGFELREQEVEGLAAFGR